MTTWFFLGVSGIERASLVFFCLSTSGDLDGMGWDEEKGGTNGVVLIESFPWYGCG